MNSHLFNKDLAAGYTVSKYPSRFGFGFLNEEPETLTKIHKSLIDEVLPRHLASIERTIDPKKGPWLGCQSRPTIADFAMVNRLKSLSEENSGLNSELLKPFPKICAMISAYDALPSSSIDFAN